jgi:predicted enzyme related to lactoylglutathione lyase
MTTNCRLGALGGWSLLLNLPFENSLDMKKVTGLGGIFFKCRNPDKMKEWYKRHLGLDTDGWGTNFEWRQQGDPTKKGFTQWSPSAENSSHFEPSQKEFMINYRVEDLDRLIGELKRQGVAIIGEVESFQYGKFAHIMDIEGNKLELWEPNDIEYDKIVEGRTK